MPHTPQLVPPPHTLTLIVHKRPALSHLSSFRFLHHYIENSLAMTVRQVTLKVRSVISQMEMIAHACARNSEMLPLDQPQELDRRLQLPPIPLSFTLQSKKVAEEGLGALWQKIFTWARRMDQRTMFDVNFFLFTP